MVKPLCKNLLPSCQLQFWKLYSCSYELFEIIITIVLANFLNPPSSQKPIKNPRKNVPRLTRLATIPARVASQDQPLYDPRNVSLIPATSSCLNAPYSTTLGDILSTPDTISSPNASYLTTRELCPEGLYLKTSSHISSAIFFQFWRFLLLLICLTQLLWQLRRQRLNLKIKPYTPSAIFFQLRRFLSLWIRLTQLLQ